MQICKAVAPSSLKTFATSVSQLKHPFLWQTIDSYLRPSILIDCYEVQHVSIENVAIYLARHYVSDLALDSFVATGFSTALPSLACAVSKRSCSDANWLSYRRFIICISSLVMYLEKKASRTSSFFSLIWAISALQHLRLIFPFLCIQPNCSQCQIGYHCESISRYP